MSKDDRDNKVRKILATATEALGPTEIARRIGEDWCGGAGRVDHHAPDAVT